MTFRLNIIFSGLLPVLGLLLLLGGCGEKDDQVLGPADDNPAIEANAWLWAFDADQDSLRVYDGATGSLHATFFAQPHALLHEVMAGPAGEPTVWMGSGGTGFVFTAGFGTHGDHSHMELPTSLGTVATGGGNTHLTTDPHGETVSWANDADETFTLVDVETLTPVTVGHGSPHSSSLVAHGTLLATHMNENWARLIDVDSGDIIATVTIDTLAHGEAFYEATEQAFIPCLNGITVVGLEEQENLGLIPYPEAGRVNFLLSGHDTNHALAPVKLADGAASSIWILDMQDHGLTAVSLPGAAVAWNRGEGNINLSADGAVAVLTDLEKSQVYVVDLVAGATKTITTEAANMACALGYSGDQLWLLDKASGDIHFHHQQDDVWEEGAGFTVHPGSDWIFITSLDPAVEIIRDY
jgi:hypothetical protein